MKPFHILWLTQNYPPGRGGMAQSCDRIVHGLRQRGLTVDIAHLLQGEGEPQILVQQHGRYIACPIEEDTAHALNLLWHRLRGLDVDYTHIVAFGGLLPILAGPIFAAWLRRPLITLLRGNDFDTAIFSLKRRDILRDAVTQAAAVCTVSHEAEIKLRHLFPNCAVRCIANGLDLSQWRASVDDRAEAAAFRRQQVGNGRRVLGLFGQIKPKKGGLFFLETLMAAGHADRFHLLLAGELDAKVVAFLLKQAPHITHSLYPFQDRYALIPLYLASDLVVIPSFYDGLPNVMLEAAGLGIPLLAARIGGMADHLSDQVHGLLFDPADPDSCRAAIDRAATIDDAPLAAMGQQAYRLVGETLTHAREIEAYLALLQQIDNEHG